MPQNPSKSIWTETATDTLRLFWEHASAAEIAALLGDGFTRKAVIGRGEEMPLSRAMRLAGSTINRKTVICRIKQG